MVDYLDAFERAFENALVAHVAAQELGLRVEVRGALGLAVHLRDKRVEHADSVPARDERVNEVRADEARAPCHKNEHFRRSSLLKSFMISSGGPHASSSAAKRSRREGCMKA